MNRQSKRFCRQALGFLRQGLDADPFAAGLTLCRICTDKGFAFLQLMDDSSNLNVDQECRSCHKMTCDWFEEPVIITRADARIIIFDVLKGRD